MLQRALAERRQRWIAQLMMLLALAALPARASAGALSTLTVANLSPAFDTALTEYTIPRTSACAVNVSATLTNPAHRLYIASTETASGVTRGVWVCDGVSKISLVVYSGWTEVGRYTITLVNGAPPPTAAPVATATPVPTAAGSYLSSLVVANLVPAFNASLYQYTLARTAACSIPVTATLANPALHRLYVAGTFVNSGVTTSAWVCDGRTKIDIIVYEGWSEKARYTIFMVDPPPTATATNTSTATPTSTPTSTPTYTTTFTASLTPTTTATAANVPTNEPTAAEPPSPPPTSAAPLDALAAERFLQQATFGPTAAEIAALQTKGIDQWMTEQIALSPSAIPDGLDISQVQAQVLLKMANGADQLRQRMVFALGQILVVSTSKLVNGYELIPWVRLLETHAFGNYRALLRAVTISPSMGKFLDLANSVGTGGQAPNENYPRELLQLFSIGLHELEMDGSIKLVQGAPIATYDQARIKEVARALSGWTYPTQPGQAPVSSNPEYFVGTMEPRPQHHDSGSKTLFNGVVLPAGQSVSQDLDGVIDAIFAHPNVPPFVATRLIRSLVTSNPSSAYIERVAQVFADNGQGVRGDLQAVLHAVLTDPDAALVGADDGRLRDPVLHVTGLARALGVQIANPGQFLYVMANLGQLVLAPPSVFSFYSPLAPLPGQPGKFGPEFQLYTPALAVERANFIYALLSGGFSSSFPIDLGPFTALAANAPALVEAVNQKLLFGHMSVPLKAALIDLAQHTSDPQQRAFGTLYLTAISSEFTVHTGALD